MVVVVGTIPWALGVRSYSIPISRDTYYQRVLRYSQHAFTSNTPHGASFTSPRPARTPTDTTISHLQIPPLLHLPFPHLSIGIYYNYAWIPLTYDVRGRQLAHTLLKVPEVQCDSLDQTTMSIVSWASNIQKNLYCAPSDEAWVFSLIRCERPKGRIASSEFLFLLF